MLVLKLCEQLCPEKILVIPSTKLGDGADGEVFDIVDDPYKVIKFCLLLETMNNFNDYYNQMRSAIKHLQDHPSHTYARVYTYAYLGEFSRGEAWSEQKFILYYYIMEKLYKTSEDERKVFHTILSHEDNNINKNYSLVEVRKMLKGLSRGLDFDAEKVIFFCNNFKKTPVIHNDIHVRNIMKDADGNFKLIDFDRCKLQHGD